MGIARDGNARTPNPVRFPNARTDLTQRVRAVGKSTSVDVDYVIHGADVLFNNGTRKEKLSDVTVSTNGTNVTLNASFKLASGSSAPDRFRVTGTFNDRNSSDRFETKWTVAVLKSVAVRKTVVPLALAPADEKPMRARKKKAVKRKIVKKKVVKKKAAKKKAVKRRAMKKTTTKKKAVRKKAKKKATRKRPRAGATKRD